MKNVLRLLPLFFALSLVVCSCNKEDETPTNNCTTDPTVTVAENIIGTWTIDGDSNETVTFNADGSGSSSEDAFQFSASNENKDYHNFDWAVENDSVVVVTYDYSPDTPTVPFIVSEDYTVTTNECDKVEMDTAFGSMIELTK